MYQRPWLFRGVFVAGFLILAEIQKPGIEVLVNLADDETKDTVFDQATIAQSRGLVAEKAWRQAVEVEAEFVIMLWPFVRLERVDDDVFLLERYVHYSCCEYTAGCMRRVGFLSSFVEKLGCGSGWRSCLPSEVKARFLWQRRVIVLHVLLYVKLLTVTSRGIC